MASSSKSKGNGDDSKHFAPGDVVLGKIKGYPPWPGILMDDENVPKKKVLSARPGKNYHIVRFFPAADYGFNKSHELKRLQRREIEAYLSDPHKKAADLREAYEIAKDPEDWNEKQNKIVRKAEAKGGDDNDDEADEEEEEEEEEEEKPVKKRKASQSDGHIKKPKVNSSSSSKKATPAKNSATRKSVGTEEAEGDDGENLDPETKKVRSWRHSLQRGFLSKDRSINPDDMGHLNKTMELVEEYDGITRDILRLTKIGKVMRRIIVLEGIPREDEFKFKERAEKLCDKWASVFTTDASAPTTQPTTGATNGTASSQSPVKEESTSAPPAAADESVLSNA